MRIAAILEYNGASFNGWQSQSHAPCVQLPVEDAFSRVADKPVRVICAGRTDTGVHASHQVVHFETDAIRDESEWVRGANANLPSTITVRKVKFVDDEFHARYSATARHYTYIILNRRERASLLNALVYVHARSLDEVAMHKAAQSLVGEHDFSSFRAAGCGARTPVREIRTIDVTRVDERIILKVCANAFLQHMVRNIAGALIAVGQGDEDDTYIGRLLAARDRTKGSVTAPPHGLYLSGVEYPEKYGLPARSPIYVEPDVAPC